MPHILTGEIRRDVYRKEGSNANGTYVMYGVDMSESFKDRRNGDERTYTNYRFTVFAKTPNAIQFYDGILQKGKIISVQCDALKIDQRDGNDGRVFTTLEMIDAKVIFGQRDAGQPSGQSWGQPQQPRTPPKQQQAPKDFDDDIPF